MSPQQIAALFDYNSEQKCVFSGCGGNDLCSLVKHTFVALLTLAPCCCKQTNKDN